MPRLIFKCPHIKGGTSAATAHVENYVKYMATRSGAERVDPGRVFPVPLDKAGELTVFCIGIEVAFCAGLPIF